jgi:hypothetical protein
MTTYQWVGMSLGIVCTIVCAGGFIRSRAMLKSEDGRIVLDGIAFLALSLILLGMTWELAAHLAGW